MARFTLERIVRGREVHIIHADSLADAIAIWNGDKDGETDLHEDEVTDVYAQHWYDADDNDITDAADEIEAETAEAAWEAAELKRLEAENEKGTFT